MLYDVTFRNEDIINGGRTLVQSTVKIFNITRSNLRCMLTSCFPRLVIVVLPGHKNSFMSRCRNETVSRKHINLWQGCSLYAFRSNSAIYSVKHFGPPTWNAVYWVIERHSILYPSLSVLGQRIWAAVTSTIEKFLIDFKKMIVTTGES